MSDGNFNRALLPPGGYAAGVRAGEARMRTRALQAFTRWYAAAHPQASSPEREAAYLNFRKALLG